MSFTAAEAWQVVVGLLRFVIRILRREMIMNKLKQRSPPPTHLARVHCHCAFTRFKNRNDVTNQCRITLFGQVRFKTCE